MLKNKKTLIIVLLLITLTIAFILVFCRKSTKPEVTTDPSKNTAKSGQTPDKNKENYSTEEEKVVLNFKDRQVVMRGFPLISKDYVKIFRFVYLGMGGDENDFVQKEVSVDQQGNYSYKLSATKNRIFTGVGKDNEGQPIKQTMEIVPLENLQEISNNCQTGDEDVNGLAAKTIDCPDFILAACWIPIDEKEAILYQQESGGKMYEGNMCENLRKNGINSITFQPY